MKFQDITSTVTLLKFLGLFVSRSESNMEKVEEVLKIERDAKNLKAALKANTSTVKMHISKISRRMVETKAGSEKLKEISEMKLAAKYKEYIQSFLA